MMTIVHATHVHKMGNVMDGKCNFVVHYVIILD